MARAVESGKRHHADVVHSENETNHKNPSNKNNNESCEELPGDYTSSVKASIFKDPVSNVVSDLPSERARSRCH